MKMTFVVAATENNVIGIGNEMPWHLPDDLKFFKKVTLGKPVLMGRKTWLSLGCALPGRLNIVLSSSHPDVPDGVMLFSKAGEALEYLKKNGTEEVCVIGGGQIFEQLLERADTVFLTRIHTVIEGGEVFFPELNPAEWQIVSEELHPADQKHPYSFTFQQWERIEN